MVELSIKVDPGIIKRMDEQASLALILLKDITLSSLGLPHTDISGITEALLR